MTPPADSSMTATDWVALTALILAFASSVLHFFKFKPSAQPVVSTVETMLDRLSELLSGHTQQMQTLNRTLALLAAPQVTVVAGEAPGAALPSSPASKVTTMPINVKLEGRPLGKEGGFGVAALLVILAWIALVTLTIVACATVEKGAKTAGHAVVDCTQQDVAGIAAVAAELAGDIAVDVAGAGVIDWAHLEHDAIAQGQAIGGCAYAEVVAAITAHPAPPPAAEAHTFVANGSGVGSTAGVDARASLERVRAQLGGAAWKLPTGGTL